MEELKTYRLADICNSIQTGPFGSQLHKSDYVEFGTPIVMPKDITNGKINDNNISRISKNDVARLFKHKLVPGNIIYPRRGDISKCALITSKEDGWVCGTGCIKVDINQQIANSTYVMYVLCQSETVNWIESNAVGTTMLNLNTSILSDLPIKLPSLNTQKKLANIVSSFDKKIALNRRINDNLEQQAQALFKSWFVDFEPFKNGKFVESEMGMIPEGWKVGTIGEYCSIRSGYAFKSSWWQETGTKVIKIKNITDNKTLDMSDCSYVSSDKTYKAIDFQASPGDLIIAMTGATIGKFCIIPFHNDKIYINQRVGKFFLGNNPLDRLPFIYCCLSYEPIYNEIIRKGQGSAQPNIGGADIENIRIVLSPSTELKEFNSLLRPIFQKKMQIEYELSKLSVLRDTLLPRLMSGELKINDLNC